MRPPAFVVQPIPSRCQSGGGRCCFAGADPATGRQRTERNAAFALAGPDGALVPGCWYCEPHARAIVAEYEAKIGERWTLVPIVREAPTLRVVAVERGRHPRTRTEFRVFVHVTPGGAGAWLLPGGRRWWRNDAPGRPIPRFATFKHRADAEHAAAAAPPPPWMETANDAPRP